MLVIAKQLGEHPQGVWRQPGEKFEFKGKKLGSWMLSAKEAKTNAEADADVKAEQAAEAEKAAQDQAEAKAEADAEEAAKVKAEEADAEALAKKVADDLAKEEADKADAKAKEEAAEADVKPAFKAIHRGAGKWDVFNSELNVVEGGDNLDKAGAAALVEKLLAPAE